MYLTPIAAGDLFPGATSLLWGKLLLPWCFFIYIIPGASLYIADYVKYMHLRDVPAHTEKSLEKLEKRTNR